MNGFVSYDESLKKSMFKLIDFEYLITHPEAKFKVWEKYNNDPTFKLKVDELLSIDISFKTRFNKVFNGFIKNR